MIMKACSRIVADHCSAEAALITRVPLLLSSFFVVVAVTGTRRNGLATVRSTGIVWQQMGKVSMAVRSAAMSHIGCLRFWHGNHVPLLYVHTFRQVVPEICFSSLQGCVEFDLFEYRMLSVLCTMKSEKKIGQFTCAVFTKELSFGNDD